MLIKHCTCETCEVGLGGCEAGWEIKRVLLSPLPIAGLSGGAELSNASSWVVGVSSSLGEDSRSCKCNQRVWSLIVCTILNSYCSGFAVHSV